MNVVMLLPRSAGPAMLALLLLSTAPATAVEPAGTSMPSVDAVFSEYDSEMSPGCALGVIRDGEFVYRRGYGMANLEHAVPITSRSVFRTASGSKQFTAMAIALLAEQRKLSLDASLSEFYPAFPEWAAQITVSQLVLHTSGIRDYLTLAWLAGRGDDQDYYTTDWVIRLLARQRETNFEPGTAWLYSNSGYLLLGDIVEKVSGSTLKDFSQQQIFGPLGMTHSHFHDDHTHIVPERAAGYAPADDGFRISMTTLDIVGDGGVYTSTDDLLAWDENFYHNRLGNSDQSLITTVTTPGSLKDGEPIDYAFGLAIGEYRGRKTVSHGGAFVGFRTYMTRFPELRFSVSVLCNRSDARPEGLARHVADIFLGDVLAPVPETPLDEQPSELNAEQLSRYAGDFWEHDLAFAAETRVEEGKLWAVHSPTRRNQLIPLGDDRFRMIGLPVDVIVEYEMSGDTIEAVRRITGGKPNGTFIPFERRRVQPEELAEYRADYYSPELDVEYRIRVNGHMLQLHYADEPPADLNPMFDDTFEHPERGAFEFLRSPDGNVSGLRLQSGRVRNLLFYREI